jgi:hypothetical protein
MNKNTSLILDNDFKKSYVEYFINTSERKNGINI